MNGHGIPTTYANTRFRSRVEARWAAFFDAFGWHWEYEPWDAHHYIPDFALMAKDGSVIVEVKAHLDVRSIAAVAIDSCARVGGQLVLSVGGTAPVGYLDGKNPMIGVVAWDVGGDVGLVGGPAWIEGSAIIAGLRNANGGGEYAPWWDLGVRGRRAHPVDVSRTWAHARNVTQWKAS